MEWKLKEINIDSGSREFNHGMVLISIRAHSYTKEKQAIMFACSFHLFLSAATAAFFHQISI
jgi:hypothetical protein